MLPFMEDAAQRADRKRILVIPRVIPTQSRALRLRALIIAHRALLWILTIAVVGMAATHTASATDQQIAGPIVVTRISQPIVLDGLSNEPAWRDVQPLEMIMFLPVWGSPPSQRTEFLVAYDDDYLYVAGRLYDGDPDRIQANSKQRDSGDASSDWFGVVIDTFNDKENALSFFTTPAGLRWDSAVQNDHEPPARRNMDWNAFWDVATIRTDDGWFAEMRIPFSTLRFQEDEEGRVVMGLIVRRAIARNEEWDVYPAIPPTWGFSGLFKPSQAQEIVLSGIRGRRGLYVAPYVLAGKKRIDVVGEPASGSADSDFEVGLDLKYLISSNVTLDLTINPDFAQVEADDVQFNLTRFPLFFPEKRPFFQERASNFEFNFGGHDRVFHSRRIGIEGGRPVPIRGGLRLVGRTGPWDFGALDIQTTSSESKSGENFGLLRVRRRVINQYSYVGGIITSRVGRDGGSNYVFGLDGIFRLFGDDYLTAKWAQSKTSGDDDGGLGIDSSRAFLRLERRTIEGLAYDMQISHVGADYEPGLGFQRRSDASWAFATFGYGWLPDAPSSLYSHRVELYGFAARRNSDGALESARLAPVWVFETRSGWWGRISPRLSYEDILEPFDLGQGVEIPVGGYRVAWVKGQLDTPNGRAASVGFTTELGEFYDGSFVSVIIEPRLRVGGSLDLSGGFELTRARFPDRESKLDSRIARVRTLYMFSTRLSASLLAQYSNTTGTVSFSSRLRYNPREGVDLWLVYDEVNARSGRTVPLNLARVDGRSMMVKFTYTVVR